MDSGVPLQEQHGSEDWWGERAGPTSRVVLRRVVLQYGMRLGSWRIWGVFSRATWCSSTCLRSLREMGWREEVEPCSGEVSSMETSGMGQRAKAEVQGKKSLESG